MSTEPAQYFNLQTTTYILEQREQRESYPPAYYQSRRTSYGPRAPGKTASITPELLLWKAAIYGNDCSLKRTSKTHNPVIVFKASLIQEPKSERDQAILNLCMKRKPNSFPPSPTTYRVSKDYESCDWFVITINDHVLGNVIYYPQNLLDYYNQAQAIEFPSTYLNAEGPNRIEIEMMTNYGADYEICELSLQNSTWKKPIPFDQLPRDRRW